MSMYCQNSVGVVVSEGFSEKAPATCSICTQYTALATNLRLHSSLLMQIVIHPRKRFVCRSIRTPHMYTLGLSVAGIGIWQRTDSPLIHAHSLEERVYSLWVCGLEQLDGLVIQLCRYL